MTSWTGHFVLSFYEFELKTLKVISPPLNWHCKILLCLTAHKVQYTLQWTIECSELNWLCDFKSEVGVPGCCRRRTDACDVTVWVAGVPSACRLVFLWVQNVRWLPLPATICGRKLLPSVWYLRKCISDTNTWCCKVRVMCRHSQHSEEMSCSLD